MKAGSIDLLVIIPCQIVFCFMPDLRAFVIWTEFLVLILPELDRLWSPLSLLSTSLLDRPACVVEFIHLLVVGSHCESVFVFVDLRFVS